MLPSQDHQSSYHKPCNNETKSKTKISHKSLPCIAACETNAITELRNCGIFSFNLGFLIPARQNLKALHDYDICRSCETEDIVTTQAQQGGSNFLQKRQIGVMVLPCGSRRLRSFSSRPGGSRRRAASGRRARVNGIRASGNCERRKRRG